jgi:hypothetical protein
MNGLNGILQLRAFKRPNKSLYFNRTPALPTHEAGESGRGREISYAEILALQTSSNIMA